MLSFRECAKGTTPIHDAASHGQLSAIYILIRNGGNLTVKNRKLETALDIARRKKQMSVVTVLSMKGMIVAVSRNNFYIKSLLRLFEL